MKTILSADNIHKTFIKDGMPLHVLRGINLEVEEGEILFIMGPSGAGKSTLLHILGFLDKPTEGNITFKGILIKKGDSGRKAFKRRRNIGFVFQFYNLLPDFSVLENVYLPNLIATNKTRPSIELKKRAREILRWMDLGRREGHRPDELSGGEQQRAAIARAIINQPELLLLDEPTGNLDSQNAERIWALLVKLKEEKGHTIVVVTHNEELAKRGTRRIYLKDGIIRR